MIGVTVDDERPWRDKERRRKSPSPRLMHVETMKSRGIGKKG